MLGIGSRHAASQATAESGINSTPCPSFAYSSPSHQIAAPSFAMCHVPGAHSTPTPPPPSSARGHVFLSPSFPQHFRKWPSTGTTGLGGKGVTGDPSSLVLIRVRLHQSSYDGRGKGAGRARVRRKASYLVQLCCRTFCLVYRTCTPTEKGDVTARRALLPCFGHTVGRACVSRGAVRSALLSAWCMTGR